MFYLKIILAFSTQAYLILIHLKDDPATTKIMNKEELIVLKRCVSNYPNYLFRGFRVLAHLLSNQ
jgi:hypothetical protein